jgi:hypothetical protein
MRAEQAIITFEWRSTRRMSYAVDILPLEYSEHMTESHAFISYVREDAESVDQLQEALQDAGILVWRDVDALWPGEDWRLRIRSAITDGSFVFIACFSSNSERRPKSYQREEVILAVEQLRLRDARLPWLIPVKLEDVELPYYDLGSGRTLDNLNWVDLWGGDQRQGIIRIVSGVSRILGAQEVGITRETTPNPSEVLDKFKAMLPNFERRIELDAFMTQLTRDTVSRLFDRERFPSDSEELTDTPQGIRFLAKQSDEQMESSHELIQCLAGGCTWGTEEQERLWRGAVEQVSSAATRESGKTYLQALRMIPVTALVYTGAIGAVSRENYSALRAIAVDARFKGMSNSKSPRIIGEINPFRLFPDDFVVPTALLRELAGEPMTDAELQALKMNSSPFVARSSQWLRSRLEVYFEGYFASSGIYGEAFDRAEFWLSSLAIDDAYTRDASARQEFVGWVGTFVNSPNVGDVEFGTDLIEAIERQGTNWPPLRSSLFGGDVDRARKAVTTLLEKTRTSRNFFRIGF